MSDDGYGKYRKMLKMGIPRQQVNASMQMDGKDPSKFSEQDPNEAAPATDGASLDLTLKGDAYDKYRKMLKCGLPMGAAMQAMAKDGVDPKGFDLSGGGGSAPAQAPTAAIPTQETSSSESGGGFLNELKLKAEKKGNASPVTASKSSMATPKSTTPAPAAKPVASPPNISPPKVVAQPAAPVISADMFPTLKSTENSSVKSSPSATAEKKQVTESKPVHDISTSEERSPMKEERKAASPMIETPAGVESSEKAAIASQQAASESTKEPDTFANRPVSTQRSVAISERAMQATLDQVLAEEASPPVQSSPVQSSNSSPASSSGKKWTAPAKSNANANDWKDLMSANKIAVAPVETKAEAPEQRIESPSQQTETKRDSPPKPEEEARKVVALESSSASAWSPAKTETPVKTVAPPAPAPKTSPPAAAPKVVSPPAVISKPSPVASKPGTTSSMATNSAVPGKTLKKRHSNDWKAMLAPHMDPPQGASSAAKPSSTATAARPVSTSTAPAAAARPVSTTSPAAAKPVVTQSPPATKQTSPAAPVNAARPVSAAPVNAAMPAAAPVNAARPTSVTRPASNAASKTNALGLNRSAEQKLPAWAAVEKPAFLVRDGSSPKVTESKPMASEVKPVAAKSSPTISPKETKPVTAAPKATAPATKPVPVSKPAPAMQPATGSIPKGFQRRFAWE